MTTTTHIPGPWAQAQYSPCDIVVNERTMIASARHGLNDISRDQAIANARLIAAAPALMAACQAVLEEFPALDSKRIESIKAICRAAIARATLEN